MFLRKKKKQCVVCNSWIENNNAINKHGVFMCSEDCEIQYREMLQKAIADAKLDNCCGENNE